MKDEKLLQAGHTVREINHGHPTQIGGNDYPSVSSRSFKYKNAAIANPNYLEDVDIGNVRGLITQFGDRAKSIIFKIYDPVDDSYVQYNSKGAHKIIPIPKIVPIKFF